MNYWSLSLAVTIALALAVPGAYELTPAAVHDLSAKQKSAPPPPDPVSIACTIDGCQPTPPGCRTEMDRAWDGMPNGFDVVVCPPRP